MITHAISKQKKIKNTIKFKFCSKFKKNERYQDELLEARESIKSTLKQSDLVNILYQTFDKVLEKEYN